MVCLSLTTTKAKTKAAKDSVKTDATNLKRKATEEPVIEENTAPTEDQLLDFLKNALAMAKEQCEEKEDELLFMLTTLGDAELAIKTKDEEMRVMRSNRDKDIREAENMKDQEILVLKRRIQDLERTNFEQRSILMAAGQSQEEAQAKQVRQSQLQSLSRTIKRYGHKGSDNVKHVTNLNVFRSSEQSGANSTGNSPASSAAPPSTYASVAAARGTTTTASTATQAATPYRIPKREPQMQPPAHLAGPSYPAPAAAAWAPPMYQGQGWNAPAVPAAPPAAMAPPAALAAPPTPAAQFWPQGAAQAQAQSPLAAPAPVSAPSQPHFPRGLRICSRQGCDYTNNGCPFIHPSTGNTNIFNYLPEDLSNLDNCRQDDSCPGGERAGSGPEPGRPGRP